MCIVLFSHPLIGQRKGSFPKTYYFNSEFEKVKQYDKEGLTLTVQKLSDSNYCYHYYNNTSGKLHAVESYKQADDSVGNGRFAYYNALGLLEFAGMVKNGKRDGAWLFCTYEKSIDKPDFKVKNYGEVVDRGYQDAVADTALKATFKGSHSNYEIKEFNYPKEAQDAGIKGTVKVFYFIERNGAVCPFTAVLQSQNFHLDQELYRVVIKSSGRWTAPEKDGVPLITFKIGVSIFDLK